MRSHRIASAIAISVAAVLLAAPPSQAAEILIDYDLTGTTVEFFGGILTIPSAGSITSGSVRVTVQGSALTNASAGLARVRNLTLAGTVDGTVGGAVLITGNFSGNQVGFATGSLSGGLGILNAGSINLNLNGLLSCFGGLCGALGTFPASALSSSTILAGVFGIGGFNTVGAATLTAVFTIDIGGNTAVVNLVGQEVSRSLTPEPNSFLLVGLGMLGLAGIGAQRRKAS